MYQHSFAVVPNEGGGGDGSANHYGCCSISLSAFVGLALVVNPGLSSLPLGRKLYGSGRKARMKSRVRASAPVLRAMGRSTKERRRV